MPDLALVHSSSPARHGNPPFPGLVLLHGLGSNERDLLPLASQLDSGIHVISARAPLPYRGGGYAWYDIEQHGPGLGSESIERALQELDRFLQQVLEAYPIDPQRLFLGGFSMGAAMTAAMTLLHPQRIAGAILISGFLPPDQDDRYRASDASGLQIFQGNGTYDPLVLIDYARLTRNFLIGAGVDLTYREYPLAHQVSMEELQDIAAWLETVLRRAGTVR